MICFDRHYPESICTCALEDAQLIVIPTANTRDEQLELFEWELRVAAMQSGLFIAMCNRVGLEQGMDSCGQSMVVRPDGEGLARADDTEQILYDEVDLDLVAVQYPVDINFGDKIKLVGYELNGETWHPGDTLLVTLYWEALEGLDQDLWLFIRLVHRRGSDLVFKNGCPSAGRYTTDFWKHGDLILSVHRLRIPDDATRHRYRLTMFMHPFGSLDWLPVLDEQGAVTRDILVFNSTPVRAQLGLRTFLLGLRTVLSDV